MAVNEQAFDQARATIERLEEGSAMKAIGQLVIALKLGQDNIGSRISNMETKINTVKAETVQHVQTVKQDLEAEIDNRTLNDFWSRQEEYNVRSQITFVDEPKNTNNGKKGAESNVKDVAIKRIKELIGDRNAEVGFQDSWVQHAVRYKQTFRSSRKTASGSEFDCVKVFLISDHAASSIMNMGRIRGEDGFRPGQTLIQSKMYKMSKQVVDQFNHDPNHHGSWKVRNYRPTFVGYKQGVDDSQKRYQRPPSNFVPDPYYFLESLRKGPTSRIRASVPNQQPSQQFTQSLGLPLHHAPQVPQPGGPAPPPQAQYSQFPHGAQPPPLQPPTGPMHTMPPPQNYAPAGPSVGGTVHLNAHEYEAWLRYKGQTHVPGAHGGAFMQSQQQYSNYETSLTPKSTPPLSNSSFIPPTPEMQRPPRPNFDNSVIPLSPSFLADPTNGMEQASHNSLPKTSKRVRSPGSGDKKTSKQRLEDLEETSEPETETDSVACEEDDELSRTESQVTASCQLFQERAKYNSIKKRMSIVGLGEKEAVEHVEAIQLEILNKVEEAEKIHGSTKGRQIQRNIKLSDEINEDVPLLPFLERGLRPYPSETVLPPLTLEVIEKIESLQEIGKLDLIQDLRSKCKEIFASRMDPKRYTMYVSSYNQSLAKEYGKGAPQH